MKLNQYMYAEVNGSIFHSSYSLLICPSEVYILCLKNFQANCFESTPSCRIPFCFSFGSRVVQPFLRQLTSVVFLPHPG